MLIWFLIVYAEVHAEQTNAIRLAVGCDDMQNGLDRNVLPKSIAAKEFCGKLVEADYVGVVREQSELKSLDAVFASQSAEVTT